MAIANYAAFGTISLDKRRWMLYAMGMGQIAIVIFFLALFVAFVAFPAWLIWMGVSNFVAEQKDPWCHTLHPSGVKRRPNHPVGQTYQERQEWSGPRQLQAEGKNWL